MENLLNFKKEEKGYTRFYPTRENIKANIGKKICYVDYVEPYRGTYFVRYGIIHSIRYPQLILDDMSRQVDIRNIKDCGIETGVGANVL
jgi:hypothetical protein